MAVGEVPSGISQSARTRDLKRSSGFISRRRSEPKFLLAGDAEAGEEYVAAPYLAYIPGDAVWPVMIACDIPVYWKLPI
jgi:hypothetical protein